MLLCRNVSHAPMPSTPSHNDESSLASPLQLHTLRDGRRVRTLRGLAQEVFGRRGRQIVMGLQMIDMVRLGFQYICKPSLLHPPC
jgi:hypothetical protein